MLLIVLILCLNTYSQDFEKMDKKELKTTLKKIISAHDSLTFIFSGKEKELVWLKQKVILFNDSLKAQKAKISSLLLQKKQDEETRNLLSKNLKILKDSVATIKAFTPFTISSFTLKSLPKNCSMVYAESKELFKLKKYTCYWGEHEADTSLILYINDIKTILQRIDNEDETDDYQYKNEKYFVKIRKRKTINENDIVLIIESAELLIKNIATGQEIIKKIYGEGGC